MQSVATSNSSCASWCPVDPSPDASASLSSTSDDDDARSSHSSGGSSAWAKAFAFIHHTSNPVVGNSADRSSSTERHVSAAHQGSDPLKAAETDKFLAGFEDPDASSKKTKLHLVTSHSTTYNPDSPLNKGSDPLKSAENDKFLAGFLGGR